MKILPTITEPVYPPPGTKGTGTGVLWTPRELQVLRERYISEGAIACAALLPTRKLEGIRNKAAALGLRQQKRHAPTRKSNDMLDAAIKRLYGKGLKKGTLKEFCARYGVTRQWVYWRAVTIGATQARSDYTRPWTQEEDAIIEAHAEKCPAAIAKKLRKAGFERTPSATQARRVRLGIYMPDPDTFTANSLAKCMGLDCHRVLAFIERHGLKAKRAGTPSVRDQWLIRRHDIRKWLIESAEWDHRRCNREWLIEILAGRIGPRSFGSSDDRQEDEMEATEIEAEEADAGDYFFNSRFPKPDWFSTGREDR